jgi:hypothetical protein
MTRMSTLAPPAARDRLFLRTISKTISILVVVEGDGGGCDGESKEEDI